VSRRAILVLAGLGVLVAIGAFVLTRGSASQATSDYHVDVIFDNARGLVPGQLVEVAGGRVGKIEKVSLTADFKARISLSVDGRFAPFHKDARCSIRPQGLIAEHFVQCDPGTAKAPELRGQGGQPPTVPVTHTTEPVTLTDLFEIWNAPTSERLTVLLSELGISTAGRGADINAILRRSNPALAQARNVIRILVDERAQVLSGIDDTTRVLAALGPHASSTRALISHADSVLGRTADHAGDLHAAVERLPPLLRAARPALVQLNALADAGTPLLTQLQRSAPDVIALTRDAPRLAAAARPVLRKTGPVLERGAGIVQAAKPVTHALAVYAHQSLPSAKLSGTLLPNLRERGFFHNLMRFFYNASVATARFDSVSHILPAHISFGPCAQYASTPVDGCSAKYSGSGGGGGSKAKKKAGTSRPHRRSRRHRQPSAPSAAPSTPSVPTRSTPSHPDLPAPVQDALGAVPNTANDTLEQALDYLLR
jgi:ABC-type transporter Mla subunit MlaD